jgi:hypothetical protein
LEGPQQVPERDRLRGLKCSQSASG